MNVKRATSEASAKFLSKQAWKAFEQLKQESLPFHAKHMVFEPFTSKPIL